VNAPRRKHSSSLLAEGMKEDRDIGESAIKDGRR